MAKKTTTKKSTRRHVPALNPARLALTLQQIEALPVPQAAKVAASETLRAAANPKGERPDIVIKTLDPDRRERIETAQAQYTPILSGPIKRGGAALLAMSDDEFQDLLNRDSQNG